MKRDWKLKEPYSKNFEEEFVEYDDLSRQLFFNREILTKNEAEKFLNPDYERDIHDPFLMKNMARAVERILKAIEKQEKIIVFGDYDADGVCGSVVFGDFFHAIGFENFEIYNPDRYKEGYGLTKKSLDALFKKNAELIITVDNGITNFNEIQEAEDKGINVIIIDHHLVPPKWPPAYAILDPRQPDETYPFSGLSGAGLAFKTVSAILKKNTFGLVSGWEKWLLDVVAIAAVADMVPLEGENRALVYWGLEVIKKKRRLGIREMARGMRMNLSSVRTDDIAFMIAPRINVAGRMDHATIAGELLMTKSSEEARWLSKRLEEKNKERKVLVGEIVDYVKKQISVDNPPSIVILGDLSWQSGVLGVAINRLLETFSCPVILWGKAGGEIIKGSIRSDGTINVVELMRKSGEEMYIDFGGHAMAGGFSLKEEYLEEFETKVKAAFEKLPKEKNLYGELIIEKELPLDEVNKKTIGEISRFEPFGQGNPKPTFLFKNLRIESVRTFGNDGIHLEFAFKNAEGKIIKAIGFWTSNHPDPVAKGDHIDLAAAMEMSNFRGYDELRLRIVDFRKV